MATVGATRLNPSTALAESWRRAASRLAVIESVESGGRKIPARSALPGLAVFEHPGPCLVVLRGWLPSDRWLVISRDLLERFDEESLIQALMEGVRALDRRDVVLRSALAAAATLLCRIVPVHRLDGLESTKWGRGRISLLLTIAALPIYSLLVGAPLTELSLGTVPIRLRALGGQSGGGASKRSLRRHLRRTRGHLPPHLHALALWHSGGSRNVLSSLLEAR